MEIGRWLQQKKCTPTPFQTPKHLCCFFFLLVVLHGVGQVVDAARDRVQGFLDFFAEVRGCFFRAQGQHELVVHERHIRPRRELRHARRDHQQEQVHEEGLVFSQHVVAAAALLFELVVEVSVVALHDSPEIVHVRTAHHVAEVGGEDEVVALALDPKLGLEVAQKVPEVNVEQHAVFFHHDVVAVPVPDPQHVGGHAVRRAAGDEVLGRVFERGGLVVVRQVLPHVFLLEGAVLAAVVGLHPRRGGGLGDPFDEPQLVSRARALVRDHARLPAGFDPQPLHHAQHLPVWVFCHKKSKKT